MSKEQKLITCPYCQTIFQCDKSTETNKAIKAHYNKSRSCKEKRKRPQDQSISNALKQQKCQNDIGKLEILRQQLSNATTAVMPNYWEADDEMAIAFDNNNNVDDDDEDLEPKSRVPFADGQSMQSLDNNIDEEDFEEADPDETDFGLANDGEIDFEDVAFEQNVVFRIDNEETSQKIGENFDDDSSHDNVKMKEEVDVQVGSRMLERECAVNDIRTKQQLIRLFYFDNMPAKFNRVLGEEVDVDAAIQFLDHMVNMHMSEAEGDEFLALMDRIVSSQTGKLFPMPIRAKTLKLAFLGKADHFFPLEETTIQILPQLFEKSEKSKARIPPLKKTSILLENALSFLLLKIVPSNLTMESMASHEIGCKR